MLIQPPTATATNPAPGPTPNSGPTDTAIPRRPRLKKRLRRVIDDAALPEPLARLIITVALGSRLWPGEQADVAKELAAHFRAGLDTGHSPQDLTSAFGDPRLAAGLIRRAKRRARGPLWRAWRWFTRALAASAGAAFVVFGFLLARYYLGAPNVSVDYLAKLNAPIEATPPDQRAYSLYLQALASLPDPTQDSLAALANDLRARGVDIAPVYIDPREFIDAKPDDPAWPLAVAYADSIQPVIETLHALASKPASGILYAHSFDPAYIEARVATGHKREDFILEPSTDPTSETPPKLFDQSLISFSIPWLSHQRQFARLLALKARIAAERSDFHEAARSIRSIAGLTAHTFKRSILIEQLVGLAHLELACMTLEETFVDRMHEIPDHELSAIVHALAAAATSAPGQRLALDLTGEKYGFLDMIQRTYTDDGRGNGHITKGGILALEEYSSPRTDPSIGFESVMIATRNVLSADRRSTIKEAIELYELAENGTKLPLGVEMPPAARIDIHLETTPSPIISKYFPAIGHLVISCFTTGATRDAALIALAAEAYRRQHGSMPHRLEDLVPDFLPFAPLDPWIDAPLRFAFTDDSVTVYSVGSDLDDDSGRPAFQTVRETVVGGIYAWQVKPPPQSESLPVRTVEIQDRAAKPRLSNQPSQRTDADWVIWPQPRRIIDPQPPSPAPLPPR